MSAAPAPGAAPAGAGASLLEEAVPAAPAKEKKSRAKKAPAAPADPNVVPAPKPPTDVQVAKAIGAEEAARLDADRHKAAAAIRAAFDEEDRLADEYERTRDRADAAAVDAQARLSGTEGDRDARLRAILRPLVLGVESMSDPLTAALVGAQVAAACGNALEEARAWDRQAEREARLYEARKARAEGRAARVRRILEGFVMEYCAVAPKDAGLKRWSFPTTTIVVGERTDLKGSLEVVDNDRAADALRAVVGPMDAAAAIKVETKVYVKEARELLEAAVTAKKIPDLSKVAGFRWTAPGTISRRVEDR